MCQRFLADSRLYPFLLQVDADIATRCREAGCSCGGRLHSARYPRKPRGTPETGLDPDFSFRFSFCCDRKGCRTRQTPPSVRFFGRKVYLFVVVLLVSAMRNGASPPTARRLQELFGADRRTLDRWRVYWTRLFPDSPFWKWVRGLLVPPVREALLPSSLLERIEIGGQIERLLLALRFLSPVPCRDPVPAARLAHPSGSLGALLPRIGGLSDG